MSNILKSLEAPFPKDIAAILANYPQIDGYILKLFRMFANSRRFLEKAVPNLLDKDSPLTLRQRELVILRVTALHGCEYEWGVHVAVFAKAAGLSRLDIANILKDEISTDDWTGEDHILLTFVTQLLRKGRAPEDVLEALRSYYAVDVQLEICALTGTYSTISFAANSAEMELEDFAARFSDY
jgi:alkylhydroperoxidase family enzyme